VNGWVAVLAACVACFLLKVAGYVVPERVLAGDRAKQLAASITIALLAALVAVQTLASGGHLVVDARLPAVAVAAVALWLRAPFILVVALAAVVAAALRAVAGG
jgi:hypothetical protein